MTSTTSPPRLSSLVLICIFLFLSLTSLACAIFVLLSFPSSAPASIFWTAISALSAWFLFCFALVAWRKRALGRHWREEGAHSIQYFALIADDRSFRSENVLTSRNSIVEISPPSPFRHDRYIFLTESPQPRPPSDFSNRSFNIAIPLSSHPPAISHHAVAPAHPRPYLRLPSPRLLPALPVPRLPTAPSIALAQLQAPPPLPKPSPAQLALPRLAPLPRVPRTHAQPTDLSRPIAILPRTPLHLDVELSAPLCSFAPLSFPPLPPPPVTATAPTTRLESLRILRLATKRRQARSDELGTLDARTREGVTWGEAF
ncbi:unnamed protein product [Zymoseptoria tritici ST99CH_1E4]|uniref:Uncharacterized protein n=1 Tax=Zymoseptoria tritici ST99CH_1E4 TaxID=1276532 RepID=A0A2H1G400_ZYMTR|nr:unnamed protein product [Zymoseptoria tritici ST99CH_1E4]